MTTRLSSFVPWREDGPSWPCVWCGEQTDIRADTPFRPDLGSLPLHLFCGAEVIQVYHRILAGDTLTTQEQTRVLGLTSLPQLETSGG